ncbi:MAG: hypothetical protein RL375_3223 [Pseudomonadota bacterium]
MFSNRHPHPPRIDRSIQVSIWLVAAALILLTWVHVSSLVREGTDREREAALRDLENLTRVSQEHADRTLRSADQVIRFVQQRYLEIGDKLDLTALTHQGVIDAENFNQVGIIDAKGIYVMANLPVTGKLDLSDREHFKVHVASDTGELFVSKPLLGRATGKWSIQLTRRITRANGDFAGVVVISMDPQYFTGFYADLKLGGQGMAALYGLDGIARARRAGNKIGFGASAVSSPMFPRIAAGQLSGSYTDKSVVDGVERFMYFRKLPHYPLAVVAGQDVDEVFTNQRKTRDALFMQGSVVTLLIIALALGLSHYLRKIKRDMAVRHAAQMQLSDRTEQLNAIFSLSPDGFVTFDRGHRVKYVNPAFLRMTRAEGTSLEGMEEADFNAWLSSRCVSGAAFPGLSRLIDDNEAEENSRRVNVSIVGSANRILQVGLRNSEEGTVSRILYFRDVTRETEVDQIKSEFLSTAAHELRTPMASIFGFSEVLLKTEVDAQTGREFLGIIYEQSNNMARILDELLDLARMEARRGKDFKLALLDLNALIGDVVRSYKYPPGRAMAEIDLPAAPLSVLADSGKLRQAVLNVLSNAYKYSPDGGPVQVVVDVVDHRNRSCVCIKVVDHGIGMTEEQSRHVCERFYRADKSGKLPGTGLGMSIVKEIVELHGGAVTITSTLGQGSTICLYLPIDVAAVPLAPEAELAH